MTKHPKQVLQKLCARLFWIVAWFTKYVVWSECNL